MKKNADCADFGAQITQMRFAQNKLYNKNKLHMYTSRATRCDLRFAMKGEGGASHKYLAANIHKALRAK